jgi:aminoglycoside/choline kinase family phosphotransferase
MPHADARLALVNHWLTHDLKLPVLGIAPASSDASFRRYFRVTHRNGTFIVMDAPPDKEDVRPYLKVGALLESLGVHVPRVHEADAARGLVLLEDLGTTQYLGQLNGATVDALYGDALATLATVQTRGLEAAQQLPPYDRTQLLNELELMPHWFCGRHLELDLEPAVRAMLSQAFEFLMAEALAQPQVFVHRDYHSRNLMVLSQRNPGVLDFQDALRGPIGYDLVSLLKDCYIAWPRERVVAWVSAHAAKLRAGGASAPEARELLRWFDLIGVQRHLKVLGIFARLWYRDGKVGYLRDLPLTLQYVLDICPAYPELHELGDFLQRHAATALAQANARAAQAAEASAARALQGT